jgi:hypothetical protein
MRLQGSCEHHVQSRHPLSMSSTGFPAMAGMKRPLCNGCCSYHLFGSSIYWMDLSIYTLYKYHSDRYADFTISKAPLYSLYHGSTSPAHRRGYQHHPGTGSGLSRNNLPISTFPRTPSPGLIQRFLKQFRQPVSWRGPRMKFPYHFFFPLLISIILVGCLQQTVPSALGALQRDRVVLTATAGEIILEQPIREGSPVHVGDLLVRLDDTLQQAIVDQAEAETARAAAYLEQLRNGPRREEIAAAGARVTSGEALLKNAELTLERTRTLQSTKALGQADLDQAVARHATEHASLLVARDELRLLVNGTRPEELKQAEAELKAAQAHLQQQRTLLKEYHVTATREGWLDSLPWNVCVFQ